MTSPWEVQEFDGRGSHLHIHRQKSAGGHSSVFCPRMATSRPIEACAECDFCDGVHLDKSEGDSFVSCRWGDLVPPEIVRIPRPIEHMGNPILGKRVSEVMTPNVVCVGAEMTLTRVANLFIDEGISGAPVVDEDNRPIGLITKTDLVREVAGTGDLEEALVEDVMNRITFAVLATTTIGQASAIMAHEGVHRVVVISAAGQVVGILSAIDIMRMLARADGFVVPSRPKAPR